MHVDTRWRRGGGFDGKMTDSSMQHAYLLTRVKKKPSVAHNYQVVAKNKKKKIKESLDSLGGMLQNDAVTECLVSD